jgi:hypothetical protein
MILGGFMIGVCSRYVLRGTRNGFVKSASTITNYLLLFVGGLMANFILPYTFTLNKIMNNIDQNTDFETRS